MSKTVTISAKRHRMLLKAYRRSQQCTVLDPGPLVQGYGDQWCGWLRAAAQANMEVIATQEAGQIRLSMRVPV